MVQVKRHFQVITMNDLDKHYPLIIKSELT